MLDEAHLVPPFEKLLETIADGGAVFGPRDGTLRKLVPPFKLLSLSATNRTPAANSFGLKDADLRHPIVRRRLEVATLLDECSSHWGFEDPDYRFYHQSFKVYSPTP